MCIHEHQCSGCHSPVAAVASAQVFQRACYGSCTAAMLAVQASAFRRRVAAELPVRRQHCSVWRCSWAATRMLHGGAGYKAASQPLSASAKEDQCCSECWQEAVGLQGVPTMCPMTGQHSVPSTRPPPTMCSWFRYEKSWLTAWVPPVQLDRILAFSSGPCDLKQAC